ncbi:NAD(P)-dependent oxidoreductase [Streptomyces albiaxialis]|uniref:NAD(P)-dependent oxidoreductase n=1 Tax=Streptomyces albiaxialis TaxID=329523 RepID=A0ABN2VRB0_9ACTN
MRVLIAGATGVIGSRLAPLLHAAGHDVVPVSRRHGVDALDRDRLTRAVHDARPDAVVNMLTAIPAAVNPRRLARDFAATNRLRTEATRTLNAAAREAGATRIVAQGLAYGYQPGDGLADEDAPLWLEHTPKQFAPNLDALIELERLTTETEGTVLRLGHLYGPGTAFAADGSYVQAVRAGKLPLVGSGTGVFSFTHTHDAAAAIVAALDADVTGPLNIVDETPVTAAEWIPALAALLDAPAPKRVPAPLARLAIGGFGVAFMNDLRGADNSRAKQHLDWRPRHASWHEGLTAELRTHSAA